MDIGSLHERMSDDVGISDLECRDIFYTAFKKKERTCFGIRYVYRCVFNEIKYLLT